MPTAPVIDYYELLEVDPKADADTIRNAFRKKAALFHPDRNPGNAEAEKLYKNLSDAYSVLLDERSRAAYDRARSAQLGFMGGVDLSTVIGELDGVFDFVSDVLEEFGSNRGRTPKGGCKRCRGEGSLSLDLGILEVRRSCPGCGGSGRHKEAQERVK